MPLYEFECQQCQTRFEIFERISNCPQVLSCPDCGYLAKKIISTKGTVFGDTPGWLNDPMVQGALTDTDSRKFRPIESRSDLKRYMKQNGICEAPKAGPRWI